MKYLKQYAIIIMIAFIGEILKYVIPLPIPSSIYGLIILFSCLMSGIIKLEQVKDVGKFLIEIMPVMFIPSAVGLLESWGILKPLMVPVITITLISTVIVMVITGRVSQRIIKISKKDK